MKIAPIVEEMQKHPEIKSILLHTGQHYDDKMSKIFFEDLKMPEPDIYLGIGPGSHAEQTAKIMVEFEKICLKEKPKLVLVVGDVNSTLACSLVSSKLSIPVAHVEAGLRSRDREMPEEINRIVTDALSDMLFTTSRDANENLIQEGIKREKIYFVGNVMIDTLMKHKEMVGNSNLLKRLGLSGGNGNAVKDFASLTLHRPSNVDDRETLKRILCALREVSEEIPIIFPIHPRTQKQVESFDFDKYFSKSGNDGVGGKGIFAIDPLGYLDFLNLVSNSRMVFSDSGGIQEETTVLGIPCITLRENTERPVTVWEGTNVVVGSNPKKIIRAATKAIYASRKQGCIPELWDGKASKRIVDICLSSGRKGSFL